MKYFVVEDGIKYFLEKPVDGKVIGFDKNKQKKEFLIVKLSKISTLDEKGGERIISPQQWLMETNSLETGNEWEVNSICIKLFLSFSGVLCQAGLLWLGFYFTYWHPILFVVSLFAGIWGYKTSKSKLCLAFGIISSVLTIISLILALIL